ncbi:MAG: cupin domain-containing protein [Filomicrobium sp.]
MTVVELKEPELDVTKSLLVRSDPNQRSGVSAETVPGSKILMHVMTIAPGQTEEPGNDLDTETAAYILSGRARVLSGKDFSVGTDVSAGDFYFTPTQLPYVIHNPYNEPMKLVLAYSLDPSIKNNCIKTNGADDAREVKVVHKPADTGKTSQTRGMQRAPAISAGTVGATQIWMCYLSVNAGERGQGHHHGEAHTAAYTISGKARIHFGPNFEEYIEPEAGDFAFDPPGLAHLVDHPFDGEPWKGVLARCPENTVVNFDE